MIREVILGTLLTACAATPHRIDVTTLAPADLPPVAVDSVAFVEPEPEGCESVARLVAVSAQSDGTNVRDELRERAAGLGANRLVLTTTPAASVEMFGGPITRTQYSALALRCDR